MNSEMMPTVAIWEKLVLSILQQKFISPWYEKIFEQIVHPMQPQTVPAVADLKMSSIAKVGSGNPGNSFHCMFGLYGTHLPLYQSKLAGQQLDQSTDRPSTTNRMLVGRVYNNIIKTLMSLDLIIFPKSVFIHKYCFFTNILYDEYESMFRWSCRIFLYFRATQKVAITTLKWNI